MVKDVSVDEYDRVADKYTITVFIGKLKFHSSFLFVRHCIVKFKNTLLI